jgi:hypothetical protein
MWKHHLFTSTELRTVSQRFYGQNFGKSECLFFISHGTLDPTVEGSKQVAKINLHKAFTSQALASLFVC